MDPSFTPGGAESALSVNIETALSVKRAGTAAGAAASASGPGRDHKPCLWRPPDVYFNLLQRQKGGEEKEEKGRGTGAVPGRTLKRPRVSIGFEWNTPGRHPLASHLSTAAF